VVTLSPWLYRNYLLFGGFPIFQTNGGFTLYYFGHNDLTEEEKQEIEKKSGHILWEKNVWKTVNRMVEGVYVPIEKPSMASMTMWIIQDNNIKDMKRRVESLNEYNIDRAFNKKAVKWMIENPQKMLYLSGKNIVKFFWIFKARNKDYKNWRLNYAYLIIFVFGIYGFYLSRKQWMTFMPIYAACLVIFMISVIFVHEERYRLPVEVLFIIFAGYAINHLIQCRGKINTKKIGNKL